MNKKIFLQILTVLSATCSASCNAECTTSLGLGWHTQGLMGNFIYTGEGKVGMFAGMALTQEPSDLDLPPVADFSWD